MDDISVLAITRNGIGIAKRLAEILPDSKIFAPKKLSDGSSDQDGLISWYDRPASEEIADLFANSNAVVCIFSLGAVIRLISPHLRNKKTDPAVVVIDDKADFVISALSGHIGGANELCREIAESLGASQVITTAADVNKTIAVDMVGRSLGWKIDNDSTVTKVSAHMVNGDPIGVFQDAGSTNWWEGGDNNNLPKNVITYDTVEQLRQSGSAACLIMTDQMIPDDMMHDDSLMGRTVVYRPPSLVVGVGLHHDTTRQTIQNGLDTCLGRFGLSSKSVARLVSIKKPDGAQAAGLVDAAAGMGVPVQYINRDELAGIKAPNPSDVVQAFEGTSSVSEAAAIMASDGGDLVVEKQKFPPDLTIAIARIRN